MIGYGTGKIILKFPPFCRLNNQERAIQNFKWKQTFLGFFHLMFWICSGFSSFVIQKGDNLKIIFLIPYPIIYNPAFTSEKIRKPTFQIKIIFFQKIKKKAVKLALLAKLKKKKLAKKALIAILLKKKKAKKVALLAKLKLKFKKFVAKKKAKKVALFAKLKALLGLVVKKKKAKKVALLAKLKKKKALG